MMVILFSTGEYRLFDATTLFKYPAFELLENEDVFKSAKIELTDKFQGENYA